MTKTEQDAPRRLYKTKADSDIVSELVGAHESVLEALENMLGAFDNAIVRRKLNAGGIKPEAIRSAKAAITKSEDALAKFKEDDQ